MGAANLTPEEQVAQLTQRVVELEKQVNDDAVRIADLEAAEKTEDVPPSPEPPTPPNPEIAQVEGEISSRKDQIATLTTEVELLEAHLKVLKGE